MSEKRRCPECKEHLPLADGITFDESDNLRCKFCDAIVLSATLKDERVEKSVSVTSWPQKNPYVYD